MNAVTEIGLTMWTTEQLPRPTRCMRVLDAKNYSQCESDHCSCTVVSLFTDTVRLQNAASATVNKLFLIDRCDHFRQRGSQDWKGDCLPFYTKQTESVFYH